MRENGFSCGKPVSGVENRWHLRRARPYIPRTENMEPAPLTHPALPAESVPAEENRAGRSPSAFSRWLRTLPYVRIGIVALAAILRLWMLDLRPPHFDEGVNGFFTDQMQRTGFYQYDPGNYHGPLHFYVLFLFKCLFGRNLWALRLPVALIGILTVDWIFRFQRFYGRRICVWTALAMALSPAYLFFHRYAIHETWLVFFMVVGWWGILGLWREGERRYLWAIGMGLAGMILTKETYLIHLVCLLAAVPCAWLLEETFPAWRRSFVRAYRPEPLEPLSSGSSLEASDNDPAPAVCDDAPPRLADGPTLQLWRWSDLAAVAAVGLGLIVFFYSGAGFNFGGLLGLVETFNRWAIKAKEGEGHIKPFYYWLEVFLRNEPWALAGLVLSVRCAFYPGAWGWPLRVLAIYAAGTFCAYCLIHYKTPWCAQAFVWPFFFLTAAVISDPLGDGRRWTGWSSILAGLGLTIYAAVLAMGEPFFTAEGSAPNALSKFLLYNQKHGIVPATALIMAGPFFLLALASLGGTAGSRWTKPGVWLAATAGAAWMVCSAYLSLDLNFRRYTDEKENYVYVHTFNEVNQIVGPLLDLAKEDPVNYHLRGIIICDSTHPLPWLLGDFTHIGYYSKRTPPADLHADFLIVSEEVNADVEAKLDDDYFKETFRLRSGLTPVTLYLRHSVFSHLMPEREPEFRPVPAEDAAP
jgi:uncharacterized protein (TIGR03663 family)